MLVIELRFPTGRYHANPWGRHVNEGVAEWPPSPYRLLRGLYDVWKRKFSEWDPDRFHAVAQLVASSPPIFSLPPVTSSHTRSYLHKNTENATDKALVFDGFVVVDRDECVYVGWPDVVASEKTRQDLNNLLGHMNYLGRSESWVTASICADTIADQSWNCRPEAGSGSESRTIRVAGVQAQVPGKTADLWLKDLEYSTADLLKQRRSQPPALQWLDYQLDEQPMPPPLSGGYGANVECILYAMHTKVRPLVAQTIAIAEQVRRNVMGAHQRVRELFDEQDPSAISPRFSGKDRQGVPLSGQQHVFYLPLDRDGDGYLDHVMISLPEGAFDRSEYLALHRVRDIVRSNGHPIALIPVGEGKRGRIVQPSPVFRSATPFVPSRHHRRGRGTWEEWVKAEVARECQVRGLPELIRIEPSAPPRLRHGRPIEWREFQRSRKDESPRMGTGFELEFREPVAGPFALGYAAHFGLGLFACALD